MKIDWMYLFLAVGLACVAVSIFRAHRTKEFQFNVFDLIMENGRVSRLAFVFMIAFAVSTWVIINKEVNGNLTVEFFGAWLAAWVVPLVSKIVSGSSATTVSSSMTVETKEVTK